MKGDFLMRTRLFIILFIVFSGALLGSSYRFIGSVSGRVVDGRTKEPLVGVNILLPALKRGTSSDTEGHYKIDQLHEGMYTLIFSYVGYAKVSRTVVLDYNDIVLNIELFESVLELPAITVTSKPQAADVLHSIQSTGVIEGRDLLISRKQTLGETLEMLPGVTTLSTGTSIAKPVIRGLTGQRVVVMTDGVRQEGQQWGDEHAPELDVFDIDRIEVVRGPGSLLYGSDAIGGVVNVIRPHVHTAPEGQSHLKGLFHLNAFSNNKQYSGALHVDGANGGFGYRGTLSLRRADDYETPKGKIYNTGFEELNGSVGTGFHSDWGFVEGNVSLFSSTLEIYKPEEEDPPFFPGGPGITPFSAKYAMYLKNSLESAKPHQKIFHGKADFRSSVIFEGIRLESILSAQQNIRREFEGEEDAHGHGAEGEASIELVTNTFTFDLKGHHRPFGQLVGSIGVSILSQDVESRKEEKLVPNSHVFDLAAFVFEEMLLDRFTLSGGVRFDRRVLEVEDSPDISVVASERTYQAIIGSLGVAWRLAPDIALIGSITKGWRAPIPFELFSSGVHHGAYTYFRGSSTLRPEEATNVELSFRYSLPRIRTEVTIYQNSIANYIFANPTGLVDLTSGYPIFDFTQAASALFQGMEFSVRAQAAHWLFIDIGADIVRGRNQDKNTAIFRIPAARVLTGVRFQGETIGGFRSPYLELKTKLVSAQNQVSSNESSSAGYMLLDVGFGFDFNLKKDIAMKVSLNADNIFDTEYTDHLSRFKPYGILNPGRNISAKIYIPFGLL